MSAWTEVKGTVRIKKDSGFSFKTYIEENFMESSPRVNQEPFHDNLLVSFEFNFSDSNLGAANCLQDFIKAIKDHDKNAWIDIYTNLRFLG